MDTILLRPLFRAKYIAEQKNKNNSHRYSIYIPTTTYYFYRIRYFLRTKQR